MNKDIVNYHMFIKDTCPTAWTDHFWFAAELVKWFKARTVVDLGVDYVQIKQFSDAGAGMPMHFDMNDYAKVQEALKKAEGRPEDR